MDQIFEFIKVYMAKNSDYEPISFIVNLAIEELFTNMVKYNTKSSEDILIILDGSRDKIVVTLVDIDSEPFDITQSADVDVRAHLDERRVGGLGIHLVRKMVDEINYRYENRQSKITFVKKLES